VTWIGGDDVVTVPLEFDVCVGSPALGEAVVGGTTTEGVDVGVVSVVLAAAVSRPPAVEVGIGIVEMGAWEVRDETP